MTEDELQAQLLRWGMCMTIMHDERETIVADSVRDHRLQRLRRYAPGTRERAERKLVGRDGSSRRAIMGAAAGLRGKLPMVYCDPIVCSETRTRGAAPHVAPVIPAELAWIDPALRRMAQTHGKRAEIVRVEYTHGRTQKQRAGHVGVGYWEYRRELDAGLSWLLGHRAAG